MTCTQLTSHGDRGSLTMAPRGAGLVVRLWRAYWQWNGRRATVEILRALDRRTLKDIGVDPAEIESLVYGKPGDRLRAYREEWHGRGGA